MEKEKKDLVVFGYGLALISCVFGVGGVFKHGWHWNTIVLLCCAFVFGVTTIGHADSLKPGYRLWMKGAHLIGGIITTLILGVVFFFLFTPIGICLWLFRKDHLNRRIDPTRATYWEKRLVEESSKERYYEQF